MSASVQGPDHFIHSGTVRVLSLLKEYVAHDGGVVLVCGPHGSGKSVLIEQFVQEAPSSWRIFRTNALANPDVRILQARIEQCFGIRPATVNNGAASYNIRTQLALVAQTYTPIAIIDDAERLDDEIMDWLVSLVAPYGSSGVGLQLVLFATAQLHAQLEQRNITVRRLELQPLGIPAIREYLQQRFFIPDTQTPFPFRMRQLRRIEMESGGWLGRIDSVANEVIAAGSGSKWSGYYMLLVTSVVILAVTLAYYLPGSAPPNTATNAAQHAPLEIYSPASDVDSQENNGAIGATELYLLEETQVFPITELQLEPAQTIITDNTEAMSGDAKGQPTSIDQPGELRVDESGWLKQQPGANYTLQLMSGSSAGGVSDLATAVQTGAPLAVASYFHEGETRYLLLHGSYPSRSEAEKAAAELERSFKIQPWIRSFDTLPQLTAHPLTGIPPVSPKAGVPTNLSGAAWLWSRNPAKYTIQLFSNEQHQALVDFVGKHQSNLPLALVRIERDGRPWFLLLAGEFGSATEAAEAIKQLPAEMQGGRPWSRSFAALQDQMATSQR